MELVALDQAIGDSGAEALERAVLALLGDEIDELADLAVVDRVLDPVGDRRVALADVKSQVDDQALADLPLGCGDTHVGVEREAADLDRDLGLGVALLVVFFLVVVLVLIVLGLLRVVRIVALELLVIFGSSIAATLKDLSVAERGRADGERVEQRRDIVDPEDACAALVGDHVGGDRAGQALARPRGR